MFPYFGFYLKQKLNMEIKKAGAATLPVFIPNTASLLFLSYPSLMQSAKTQSQTMYDPDYHRTIAQLIDHVGNKQE